MQKVVREEIQYLYKAPEDSHKGENGRLLVIGGSELFHASIFWAADVASKIVDLVHFTSAVEENNDLVRVKMKEGFWNGIVVPFEKVEDYIKEDDCILIGPGMPRRDGLMKGEKPTKEIVDYLIGKFPKSKWVVDGGALQEVDPKLLNENMIITPHKREWEMLGGEMSDNKEAMEKTLLKFSRRHNHVSVLLKGRVDFLISDRKCFFVEGGTPGMTKGGTGDVLAGLVAALYCNNNASLAIKTASYVNKKAGEKLAEKVGNYFNASDLVKAAPEVLKDL